MAEIGGSPVKGAPIHAHTKKTFKEKHVVSSIIILYSWQNYYISPT